MKPITLLSLGTVFRANAASFSIGLRAAVEDFDDMMEIFDVQKLKVSWHTNATGASPPCP
jgi:hypothetical protein